MEIQIQNLKKQFKITCTLVQYLIFLKLEIYNRLNITKLAEIIGIKDTLVANEANFLLYHPIWNAKKVATGGFILTDAKPGEDLDLKHEIWVNTNFTHNNSVLNTIPTKQRKVLNFNFLESWGR